MVIRNLEGKMKNYLYILLFFCLWCFKTVAQSTDTVRVSLLTCSPGEEIYSLFGHTAIRYEDPSRGIDRVYNYGIFSFNTPDFIWRFVKGETDYQLGVMEFPYFEIEYIMRGSSVYQQTLNLSIEEKNKLREILEENYLPENRVYRYNFFFDNCTTRARDKIEESLNGKISYKENFNEQSDRELTFREIVHQYTAGHPWEEFGIDLCIGSKADKIANNRERMFAPFNFLQSLNSAEVFLPNGTKKQLVKEFTKIVQLEEKEGKTFFPTPLQVSWALFFIILMVTIYGIYKNRMLWGLDILLFGATGVAGCVIAFLVFFSIHPAVSPNYLLLFLNPIHLFYLPFMIYFSIKRKKDWYHWINLIVLTFFILLWNVIPQKFNPAVLPLALCLWVRSACHLYLIYKRK